MSDYKENDGGFVDIKITTISSQHAGAEETFDSGTYEDEEEDQESKNTNKLFFGRREMQKKNSIDSRGVRVPGSEEEPFYKQFRQEGMPKGGIREMVPRFVTTP